MNVIYDFSVKLKNYLDRYAIGQDNYKIALSMAIYKYIKYDDTNQNILVIGPSGSGKTHLIKLLKNCPILPKEKFSVMIYDVSRLTPEGFAGSGAEDIINCWKNCCSTDKNESQKGLIFLDEFDKIIIPNTDSNGENCNRIVQFQLMNIIEGCIRKNIDTSKIMFVMGGAFTMLDNIKSSEKIGFSVDTSIVYSDEVSLREQLIKIGGQREMIGRIQSIVKLKELTKAQLKVLLLHPDPDIGIIARKRLEFNRDDLDFVFTQDLINQIINNIYAQKLGARGIKSVVNSIISGYDYQMIENNLDFVEFGVNTIKFENQRLII